MKKNEVFGKGVFNGSANIVSHCDYSTGDDKTVYRSKVVFDKEQLNCDSSINLVAYEVEKRFVEFYRKFCFDFEKKTELCRKFKCEHYHLSHELVTESGSFDIVLKTKTCSKFNTRECLYCLEDLVLNQEEVLNVDVENNRMLNPYKKV